MTRHGQRPSPATSAGMRQAAVAWLLLGTLFPLASAQSVAQSRPRLLAAATADDMPGTAKVGCASGDNCVALGGGAFSLTGFQGTASAVVGSSYFFYGVFSFSLRLQPGNTGDMTTTFSLFDTRGDNKKKQGVITLKLYTNTLSQQTMLSAEVVANQKVNQVLFQLPFDGSKAFHTYSVQWSATGILWFVDGQPIRVFWKNGNDPWPQNALRPQIQVGNDTTIAPAGVEYSPRVTTTVKSFTMTGCPVADDAQADQDGCTTSKSMAMPWNTPLTALQMKLYNAWHYTQMQGSTNGWVKNDQN